MNAKGTMNNFNKEINIKKRIKNLEWILIDLDKRIANSHYFNKAHIGNDRKIEKTTDSNNLKDKREVAFHELCVLKVELEDMDNTTERYRYMFLCKECKRQILGNRSMIRKRGVKCPFCRIRNFYTMKDKIPVKVGFKLEVSGRKWNGR